MNSLQRMSHNMSIAFVLTIFLAIVLAQAGTALTLCWNYSGSYSPEVPAPVKSRTIDMAHASQPVQCAGVDSGFNC